MSKATLLFCDVVGYSTLNDFDQERMVCELNRVVSHELYARLARVGPETVLFLPTGDGLALAFLDDADACANDLMRLIRALVEWATPRRQLRIGVHYGHVSQMRDINGRPNIFGATINECQRIMDAAHPCQVLFSHTAATQFEAALNRLGDSFRLSDEYDVVAKHELRLKVRVLYREGHALWSRPAPVPKVVELLDRISRTEFILDRLRELKAATDSANGSVVMIREQSLFSTLGIRDPLPHEDERYCHLRAEQKKLLGELVESRRIRLKLIIDPPEAGAGRAEDCQRAYNLLSWMKDHHYLWEKGFVGLARKLYQGPNRLIIGDDCCIDGYKTRVESGYDFSIVQRHKETITAVIGVFDGHFGGHDTRAAVRWLEDWLKTMRGRRAAKASAKRSGAPAAGGAKKPGRPKAG